MIRSLALLACLLTVCITASSAFIRHSRAGVGCNDWPACYHGTARAAGAHAAPAQATPRRAEPTAAQQANAGGASAGTAGAALTGPAEAAEASSAVRIARGLHRLSAMTVGILVLLIAVFGWNPMSAGTRAAVVIGLADTLFLAWLGRVTPGELPLVTLGNLLGGLVLVAVFAWVAGAPGRHDANRAARGRGDARARLPRGITVSLAFVALVLLGASAWVGTMIGAHGAIDACSVSGCLAGARFEASALDPLRSAAAIEPGVARGLHVVHRLLGVAFAVGAFILAVRIRHARPALALAITAATVAQWLLGFGTALGSQPLPTTTAHNAVAALLVLLLAFVASTASQGAPRPREVSIA